MCWMWSSYELIIMLIVTNVIISDVIRTAASSSTNYRHRSGEAPPHFNERFEPRYVADQGSSLLLECTASGFPDPFISWTKDSSTIPDGGENGIEIHEGLLEIARLTPRHRGRYTCRAASLHGQIQQHTDVQVRAPPEFTARPIGGKYNEGDRVHMSCKASGYPDKITYSWFMNDTLISRYSMSHHYTQRGEDLFIEKIRANDTGRLSCVASNGVGDSPRATTQVIVQYKAKPLRLPETTYAGVGLSTTLDCPSVAVPPVIDVMWFKDDKRVLMSQHNNFHKTKSGSLVINRVTTYDAGSYSCSPRNEHGTAGRSNPTKLMLSEPPTFLRHPNPIYISQQGDSLVVPCQGGGRLHCQVEWEKIGGEIPPNSTNIDDEHMNIKYLTKKHHGEWKCTISNIIGKKSAQVFIKVNNTSPQMVRNFTTVSVSHMGVEVAWTPGFDGGHEQTFEIWYKKQSELEFKWKFIAVGREIRRIQVTGLKPASTYQLSIAGKNQIGISSFCDILLVITKEKQRLIPRPKPTFPAPMGLHNWTNSYGQVVLSWKEVRGPPYTVRGYLVEHRLLNRRNKLTYTSLEGATLDRSVTDGWSRTGVTYSNVTDLPVPEGQMLRNKRYEFRVYAVTWTIYSEQSNKVIVSTHGMDFYPRILVDPRKSSLNMKMTAKIVSIVIGLVILKSLVIFVAMTMKRQHRNNADDGVPNNCEMKATPTKSKDGSIHQDSESESEHGNPQMTQICTSNCSLGLRSREDSKLQQKLSTTEEAILVEENQSLLRHNPMIRTFPDRTQCKRKVFVEDEQLQVQRRREITAKILQAQQSRNQLQAQLAQESAGAATDLQVAGCSSTNFNSPSYETPAFDDRRKSETGEVVFALVGNLPHASYRPPHLQPHRSAKSTTSSLYDLYHTPRSRHSFSGCQPPRGNNVVWDSHCDVTTTAASTRESTFEIDCSGSDVQVRLHSSSTAVDGKISSTDQQETECKIGPDQVELKRRVKRRRSYTIHKACNITLEEREDSTVINNMEDQTRHKSIIIEALLSPKWLPRHKTTKINNNTRQQHIDHFRRKIRLKKNIIPTPKLVNLSDIASRYGGGQRSTKTSHHRKKLNSYCSLSASSVQHFPTTSLTKTVRFATRRDSDADSSSTSSTHLLTSAHPEGGGGRRNAFTPPPRLGSVGSLRGANHVHSILKQRGNSCHEDRRSSTMEKCFRTSSATGGSTQMSQQQQLHDLYNMHGIASQSVVSEASSSKSISPVGFSAGVQTSGQQNDRNRTKDSSSVEDNYEWDSEYAMESEILEALKKFESHQTTNNMSEELREKIQSFAKEVVKRQDIASANMCKRRQQLSATSSSSSFKMAADHPNLSSSTLKNQELKADIEKRCARLKMEFQRFRDLQSYATEGEPPSPQPNSFG